MHACYDVASEPGPSAPGLLIAADRWNIHRDERRLIVLPDRYRALLVARELALAEWEQYASATLVRVAHVDGGWQELHRFGVTVATKARRSLGSVASPAF